MSQNEFDFDFPTDGLELSEKRTPIPIVFENDHNGNGCVICERYMQKYLPVRSVVWKRILTLLELYKESGKEVILNQILSEYTTLIKKPCNKIIKKGKASSHIIPYPKLTKDAIRNHCKMYSIDNELIKRYKNISQACDMIEKSHIFSENESSERFVDHKNVEVWTKLINSMIKIATSLRKKRKKNKIASKTNTQ